MQLRQFEAFKMYESQAELIKQQRIIAGCLLRMYVLDLMAAQLPCSVVDNAATLCREMRECGVWGPMPKMDGTELSPAMAAAFPRNENELKYLACKLAQMASDTVTILNGLVSSTDGDKIALVKEYSLSWSDKSSEDPGDILHKFITGRDRRSVPVKEQQKDGGWIVFVPLLGFMMFMLILIKVAPREAWTANNRG